MSKPPLSFTETTDDSIPTYLETEYKEQRIALVDRRYRYYDADTDGHYWTGSISLAILDIQGTILWEHREKSSALFNLFQLAKDKAVGIENILDSLLD
jgi:hypothetical protein